MPDPTPKKKLPRDIKSIARAFTDVSIRALAGIAENGEQEAARVSAANSLLDRGWGRAPQQLEHTGKDGDNEIRILLRTITEGKK